MNYRMTCLVALIAASLSLAAGAQETPHRNVTFLSTSDCHYAAFINEDRNDRDRDTIKHMNEIASVEWPASLGGGKIDKPRAVMVLGDCIDDGDRQFKPKDGPQQNQSAKQYEFFVKDFGFDGTDGLLKYPAFEGWGNHDGPPVGKEKVFSFQTKMKERNQLRKQKGLVSHLSENGLFYSWDWDDVHFVQLGIYPADKQRDGVHYSPVWHNPQGSLSFLKSDLAENVAKSGRPIVLMAHMGFDTDWWTRADWADFYHAVQDYNVILYLFGHSGTGIGQYAPEKGLKPINWFNEGQTENGFGVINIQDNTLRYAYRIKNWHSAKDENGKPKRSWDGQWLWKYEKSVTIAPPAAK